jgi:HD-like signal output (HDOD) protein
MPHEISAEQIRRTLQGISVPPQPQIMVDLQMEQMQPYPDVHNICRLVSQDPGLSGSLLKLVNSPFYGLSNRITSIQHAINLLGTNTVINLINAQAIKGELNDDDIVALNRFWDSAQDIAQTCLTLAKRIGYQPADEAYALGLFHNCGIPLMLKRFPEYLQVQEEAYFRATPECRVVDTENRMLDTNHAVVGYFIARSWRLPERVCEAIANHHNALSVFNEESSRNTALKNLLAILKMAEHICRCYQVLGRQERDQEWETIRAPLLDYVGLTEYEFDNLREVVLEMGVAQTY